MERCRPSAYHAASDPDTGLFASDYRPPDKSNAFQMESALAGPVPISCWGSYVYETDAAHSGCIFIHHKSLTGFRADVVPKSDEAGELEAPQLGLIPLQL